MLLDIVVITVICCYWYFHVSHISNIKKREREMFYLTTHSTHFIYGYMASDICLRTILIVRKETRCRHIGYSYRLTARVLLYTPSHRQDNTYHDLCYTSRGALAGTRNSSMGPPHEGLIQRPIAPWANALPLLKRDDSAYLNISSGLVCDLHHKLRGWAIFWVQQEVQYIWTWLRTAVLYSPTDE